jgi:predicted DNA-binding transcriptional regulator AlpA|tara:strand:+ start:103 stop:339 length:237 start_codon:yes stop_codon:yes gene_type:complete
LVIKITGIKEIQMNEEENLTPTQLAKRWGISRVWVYKLLKKGHVPKHRKTGMGVRPRIVFPMKEILIFEEKRDQLVGE